MADFNSDKPALYFYGHSGGNEHGYLSQFYTVGFDAPSAATDNDDGAGETLRFWCAEQYMMYRKAMLFNDHETAKEIMAKLPKDNPQSVKSLGRRVKGFDDEVWVEHREEIVETGNWYKFTTSTKGDLKAKLLATGERELVEAAPKDAIWGIGFGKDTAELNRSNWGLNLLGKALIRVRAKIREEETKAR